MKTATGSGIYTACALAAAALTAGALAWQLGFGTTQATVAGAEDAPALGNTLGGNDTAEKGELGVYDPSAEADASGGTSIEGSDEEKLQQERIAGGAVGDVVSKNLPELDGIVNEDKSDYVTTYGMELQAPDLPQAIIDAVEGGSLEGLPANHLDANLTVDDCASCHTIQQ